MSFRWFKQFLVFLSLFCILESTGISILSVLTKYKISQTDSQIANEDEGTSERNEAKENKLKEFWPGDTSALIKFFIRKSSLTRI
jgi:hypothetical protein